MQIQSTQYRIVEPTNERDDRTRLYYQLSRITNEMTTNEMAELIDAARAIVNRGNTPEAA